MGALQAYAGLQTSLWSYNSQIRSWEPVMEPWNTIIKLEANSTETVMLLVHAIQRVLMHT